MPTSMVLATASDGEEPWKTVVISFVEESHHEVRVNVPRDFQPERCDLANELAKPG